MGVTNQPREGVNVFLVPEYVATWSQILLQGRPCDNTLMYFAKPLACQAVNLFRFVDMTQETNKDHEGIHRRSLGRSHYFLRLGIESWIY
jgi:hypothetical protein